VRPRVEPLPVPQYRRVEREAFGARAWTGTANVSRTWAHNPALMKAQRPLQEYLRTGSTLPARDRELAILRIAGLCRSAYVAGKHAEFGRQAGLTDDEIERVTEGPGAAGWTPAESALLRAVDELHADAFVSDETWATLSETYDVPRMLDLITLVGRYWTVSAMLNTFGVPQD
jgi:4-carboxymuconolactone decarboxylase